jgi:hypothetical protein
MSYNVIEGMVRQAVRCALGRKIETVGETEGDALSLWDGEIC